MYLHHLLKKILKLVGGTCPRTRCTPSAPVSVCDSCVALKSAAAGGGGVRIVSDDKSQEINGSEHEVDSAESYDDDEDEDEDEEYSSEDEDVEEEEAENQVVPWSAEAAAQLPPMMSSSSSSDGGDLVGKRGRDCSDDEIGSSSSAQELNYSPPLKRPSREGPASKSTAAINSLTRLEGEGTLNGAVDSSLVAISRTRRDLSR